MTADFGGRHVVITGGDGALGRAVVQVFLEAGATCHLPVFGPGWPGAPAGAKVTGTMDLSDESAVLKYYADLPPLAASIHLAGGFLAKPIADTARADLEGQLKLNLVTTFLCCREAVKAFRKSGGGRIVNVAARAIEQPTAGMVAYTVSKAGVASPNPRAGRRSAGARAFWSTPSCPSIIDTPANRAAMPDADTGRWPKPAELAQTIRWLASEENRLTSGALIPVYGNA